MEVNPILSELELPTISPIQISSMQLRMWGRDMQFNCQAGLVEFQLRFLDCREMNWQVYTHLVDPENPSFPLTELVNFKIGRDEHRSPAHLLTDHFGLSLVYGALQLMHHDKIILLGTD